MKITAITTQEYRWPRAKPITNGLHTYTHVDFAVVRIETDQGVVGTGLGNGSPIWRASVATLARNQAGDTVLRFLRTLLVYRRHATGLYARVGY